MTSLIDTQGKPLARTASPIESFTFDDATPVMDRSDILDYLECWHNQRWYEPPVNFNALAKSFRASTHHSSAIFFKANVLTSTFVPHPLLTPSVFKEWAVNYFTFGNAYLERRDSLTGKPMALRHALAKYTRRGRQDGQYFYVPGLRDEHEFAPGSVFHLKEPDINQEIYGLPEYLSSLQSAWLNESATLFRRRYYNNGSHAGFVMYLSDAGTNTKDVDAIRAAMKSTKGIGNFRNLFVHSPNGNKDGLQIIPISEVAARDDFFNIKNVTRDDMLAAHRTPPQLMGIVPGNTGGFGAVLPVAQVFARNEIEPLQARFRELNNWLGLEVVRFNPYVVNVTDVRPYPLPV